MENKIKVKHDFLYFTCPKCNNMVEAVVIHSDGQGIAYTEDNMPPHVASITHKSSMMGYILCSKCNTKYRANLRLSLTPL